MGAAVLSLFVLVLAVQLSVVGCWGSNQLEKGSFGHSHGGGVVLVRRNRLGVSSLPLRRHPVSRLRGGGNADDGSESDCPGDDYGDDPVEDEVARMTRERAAEDMKKEAMGRVDLNSKSIMEAREMLEDVPEGWDADADWELRVTSREWWKEMREPKTISGLPTLRERFFHAIRVGAVPWVHEMVSGTGNWGGKIEMDAVECEERRWTGIHLAASRGNVATAKLLLENGAKHSWESNEGCRPLHLAASYGRTEMCKLLLEVGADVNAKDSYGETAVDMCVQYKRQETVRELLAAGGVSSKLKLEEVEEHAEWVQDPLWPEGYRKDLMDMSNEGGEDDDERMSELERRIYACSTNLTFSERLADYAEGIKEWETEPDANPPDRVLDMNDEDGLLPEGEGVDPASSSGWDPRVLASRTDYVSNIDAWEGDSDDFTVLKAPAMDAAATQFSGMGTAAAGLDVSTNEESDIAAAERAQVMAAAEKVDKPGDKGGDGEEESPSVSDWSDSD